MFCLIYLLVCLERAVVMCKAFTVVHLLFGIIDIVFVVLEDLFYKGFIH